MALKEDFETASKEVKTLKSRPENSTLLSLYALYKQGTEGDVSGSRPGMLDLKGRAKFDAWSSKKGLSREQAMETYVTLVKHLVASSH